MSEKPEALEVAADLRARIARHPSSDTTRTLLICDDAARCLEEQHAEIERLRGLLTEAAAIEPDCGCVGCSDKREALKVRIDAALRREPGDGEAG